MRALVAAPVGQALVGVSDWWLIPGANTGTKQAYDVLGAENLVMSAGVERFTTLKAAIVAYPALRRFLFNVPVYDSAALTNQIDLKPLQNLQIGEFFRVIDVNGNPQARTRLAGGALTWVASDRPGARGTDWHLVHEWAGITDQDLGDDA